MPHGIVQRRQTIIRPGSAECRCEIAIVMVQLSWFWLLHQPESALTKWFHERAKLGGRRKSAIIALARKLLVALWKFVHHGIVIEGAVMKRV